VRLSPIIGGAAGALVLLIAVVIAIVALLRYARKGEHSHEDVTYVARKHHLACMTIQNYVDYNEW